MLRTKEILLTILLAVSGATFAAQTVTGFDAFKHTPRPLRDEQRSPGHPEPIPAPGNPGSMPSSSNAAGGRMTGPPRVPPGLEKNAWVHSNMSIRAREVTQAIFLGGYHGVMLARIAVQSSSTGQNIRDVAFNDSMIHIRFDQAGSVLLNVSSSQRPSQVWADDKILNPAPAPAGLTPSSEAWFYDNRTYHLLIFSDPDSVTVNYGPAPIPEFPTGTLLIPMLAVMVTLAVVFAKIDAVRRRSISGT